MARRSWLVQSLRTRTGVIQWLLLIGAVAFVVWILRTRGDDLKAAFDLTPRLFWLITLSCFGTFLLNGVELQVLAGRFERRIPLGEGFLLGLMVPTLNYLPMKTGTVLNGVIMKARYRLSLSHFTALVAGSSVIHLWMGLACAGVALFAGGSTQTGMAWLFVVGPTALVAGLMWWGRAHTTGRFDEHNSKMVRAAFRAIDGAGMIFSDGRLLAIEMAINLGLIMLWALRTYWSFAALGVDASLGDAVVVTSLSVLFSRLSIIPGGIGFREAGSALGSALTGLPADAGFAASVVDRAVMLLWLLVLGVPATLAMLRLTGVGLSDALQGQPAEGVTADGGG